LFLPIFFIRYEVKEKTFSATFLVKVAQKSSFSQITHPFLALLPKVWLLRYIQMTKRLLRDAAG
jgi:hypothetical protein